MKYLFSCISIFLCFLFVKSQNSNLPQSCDSQIYCQGQLLHDVQMARIFQDSKTFVDLRLRYPPNEVLKKYEDLSKPYGGKSPPPDVLKGFVNENFEDGNELEPWTPNDWNQSPAFLNKIKDIYLKEWASDLNNLWKTLSRRMSDEVAQNPEMFSIIHLPHGFAIPGGRFKEIYYWDTNWIVNGLLVSDMYQTAKGVIENLLHLLKTMGHIPNGSRVYYQQRSHPPLLTFMVNSYLNHTSDFDFVKTNIELLDKEMDYWINTKQLEIKKNGQVYKMYRYYAPSEGPRPESYREDVDTVKNAREDHKADMYTDLKSAAESGWDFSSRWFIKGATNEGNISNINTQNIIPVDLNSIMHKNFVLLNKWYKQIGNVEKMNKYKSLSKNLQKAIQNVLWNDEERIWLDYDLLNGSPRKYFYMSNFAPLWTKSHKLSPIEATKVAINYIIRKDLCAYPGGSPTSLEYSGEQWDFPNAWAPLQAFLIQGLQNIGTPAASETAYYFANRYIHATRKGFVDFGAMFEKYDSLNMGSSGGGGEYEGQTGFGWTNGLALELLNDWGSQLTSN